MTGSRSARAWSPAAAGPLLTDDLLDLSWRDAALCAQVGGDVWFPEKGASVREAKRICGGCLVRTECLEYALEHAIRYGIWGGTTERQRRAMKPRSRVIQSAPLMCVNRLHLKNGPGRCAECKKDRDLERAKTRVRAPVKDLAA